MNPQRYNGQPSKWQTDAPWHATGWEQPRPQPAREDAADEPVQAARAVMHPESYDPDWRYYHGAWGG
jgi:hypothetical protein